jgi:allantoin racemase
MKIMFISKAPRNRSAAETAAAEKKLTANLAPDTKVVLDAPSNYDGSKAEKVLGKQKMLNGLDHAMVTTALIQKIVWAQENGFDAVVQSNNFDPGVEAARLSVKIPVIGVLKTAMHTATTLADRIGVLVPLDSHVPYTWRILKGYGLQDYVTAIRPLGIYGDDLKGRIPEITEKAKELIRGLVKETGAQFIVPLGGALIPNVVDPADLERDTNVPVINTVQTALRFAETCVRLRMTHSPYAYPRGELTYADVMGRA